MAQVQKTVRAEHDLDEIWLFVARDSLTAADRLLDDIVSSAQQLAEQPLMGRARPELREELRSFPVARYILFYRPMPEGIEIVRTLHSARDIPGLAEEEAFISD